MLKEVWEETGVKPPSLENRPTLAERWNLPYDVWAAVSGSRNYTPGGIAEIPFSEFFFWALAHEYSRSEMTSMWEDVHAIDRIYISTSTKFQKAQEESKKKA